MAEIGQYDDAIKLYDKIILFAIDDSMLNFNVKTHIFNQLLCYTGLDDWVRLEKKATEMEATYPTFAESRECQLIKVSDSVIIIQIVCRNCNQLFIFHRL